MDSVPIYRVDAAALLCTDAMHIAYILYRLNWWVRYEIDPPISIYEDPAESTHRLQVLPSDSITSPADKRQLLQCYSTRKKRHKSTFNYSSHPPGRVLMNYAAMSVVLTDKYWHGKIESNCMSLKRNFHGLFCKKEQTTKCPCPLWLCPHYKGNYILIRKQSLRTANIWSATKERVQTEHKNMVPANHS